jgi:hypothetical protein
MRIDDLPLRVTASADAQDPVQLRDAWQRQMAQATQGLLAGMYAVSREASPNVDGGRPFGQPADGQFDGQMTDMKAKAPHADAYAHHAAETLAPSTAREEAPAPLAASALPTGYVSIAQFTALQAIGQFPQAAAGTTGQLRQADVAAIPGTAMATLSEAQLAPLRLALGLPGGVSAADAEAGLGSMAKQSQSQASASGEPWASRNLHIQQDAQGRALVWLRDAQRQPGGELLQQLRTQLAALGVQLAGLTVNGKAVWQAPDVNRAEPTRYIGQPHSEAAAAASPSPYQPELHAAQRG